MDPHSAPPPEPRDAPPPPDHAAYLERRLIGLAAHMQRLVEAVPDPAAMQAAVRDHLERVARAHAGFAVDASEEALPSLERLRRRFGLSPFDESVLLLALAPAIDARFAERIAAVKRQIGHARPDVGVALELFSPSLRERVLDRAGFGPQGPLIKHHLVTLEQPATGSDNLLEMTLRVPSRIQGALLEHDAVDARLEGFSRLLWPRTPLDQVVLAAALKTSIMALVGDFDGFVARREAWGHRALGEGGEGLVLLFAGPPGTGKTLLANAVAAHLKRPLLLVDAAQLQSRRGLESNLDALMREARLQRAVLFFDDCELLFAHRLSGNRELPLLLAALDGYEGISLLATNIPHNLDPALDRRITLRLDFTIPLPSLRERIWRLHLPSDTPLDDDVDLGLLAEKFEFSGGYIRNSVTVALNRALARVADDEPRVTMSDLDEGARSQIRHKLNQLAVHGSNHLTLDDVILPDEIKTQLRAIVAAVRNRRVIFDEWGFGEKFTTGRGLCILFRGDSGTGKTLSAEILAGELALPLYRVRIPSIVSKYVGETQKNLEKCFHEAGRIGALLLFDEADSIFSKRVDVNSSNDRYSNMEVNLLLQEVERFDGVVILTTNLDAAIDDAFERRLNHKIDFPFPDARSRARIWRHLLPDQAPVEGPIRFRYLGEDYELSGGSIKNAVIRAAYQAAEHKAPITMERLEQAALQEYRELGKLLPNVRRDPWD